MLSKTLTKLNACDAIFTALQVLLFMTTLLVVSQTQALSDDEKAQITSGLEAAEAMANFVKEGNFKESLKALGSSVADYLGVVGPFVDIVLGFIKGPDSAELQYMKEMMNQIDTRFDQLDYRFNDIERLIDWTAVKVNFGVLEHNILAITERYEHIYKVPPEAVAEVKNVFVKKYESSYQDSGYKLYQIIVKPSTLQENLGVSVMRYTENDRKKTQIFLLGTMQLLLQASKVEIAYLHAVNFTHHKEFIKSVWKTRFEELKNEFEMIDRNVTEVWHSQSGKDMKKYSAKNSEMSHKNFAHGLKNMLKVKYYWRIWLVIVYNPVSGSDKHYVHKHGGHHMYREHGRNIIIASKDSQSPRMSSSIAGSRLYNTRSDASAKGYFKNMQPAPNADCWGVIRKDSNVWYAWSGGTFKRRLGAYFYSIFLAGREQFRIIEFELFMWG